MDRIATALLIFASLVSALSCGGDKTSDDDRTPHGATRTEEDDFENFLEAVATADEDGYTPYWLGRNPSFEGVAFLGPSMSDLETKVPGRISFRYDASRDDGGGSLSLALLSADAWPESGFSRPIADRVIEQFEVELLGQVATVYVIAAGVRPISATRMIVQLGDTHVVLTAKSVGDRASGGQDKNPLIYKEAFLRVVEQLRRYPD